MELKQKTKFKQTEIGMIPKDWEIKRIIDVAETNSDIVSGPFGSNLKVKDYTDFGIPIIRLQNIERWKFISDNLMYISEEKYKELEYHSFSSGDIVLAKLGDPIGKTCLVPEKINKGIITADVVRIRTDKKITDKKFILYALNSQFCAKQLSNHQSGTTRPRVNLSDVRNLLIPIPPLPNQRAIAEILSFLDSKIELNEQMNKTLESIGRAIFKHWFVDFEFPNEEGKPYKSSGGEMVYNEELGKEIPKGWESSNIEKEFNLVMGQSPPGSSYNELGEGIVFFQGRTDFGHRFPSIRMFCTEPSRFAKKGDTLISVRAPVGDINLALQDCCIGRGLAAIRHKSNYSSYTYYFMTTLKPTFDHFESEGTVFGSIGKTDFENIKILAPNKEIINSLQNILGPIDKKIEDNTLQILTLSSIRDSLLPKLMSGKIRVPVEA